MIYSFSNNYTPLHWQDRIWKLGPDGKLIPKRDENNQIIINPLTGQPEYETIEDGTRVSAGRLNHMDDGIYLAHESVIDLKMALRRLQVQMELDGRVPGNSGSFVDTFDGTATRLTLLKTSTDILEPVTSADNVISVANSEGFVPMTYATIYDADSYEHVLITAVNAGQITVQTLTNDYDKGAKIARSTTVPNTVSQSLDVQPLVTYQIDVVEVI